jgi:hypothetical protein
MSTSVFAAGWITSNNFMIVAPSLLMVTFPCKKVSTLFHMYRLDDMYRIVALAKLCQNTEASDL